MAPKPMAKGKIARFGGWDPYGNPVGWQFELVGPAGLVPSVHYDGQGRITHWAGFSLDELRTEWMVAHVDASMRK